MLTIAQNKRIAKALDLPKPCVVNENCIVFSGNLTPRCYKENFNACPNIPSFDTREGFHLIIEHGPKMEWWDEFIWSSKAMIVSCDVDYHWSWAIKQDYIGPALAIALNDWFESQDDDQGQKFKEAIWQMDKWLEGREGKCSLLNN